MRFDTTAKTTDIIMFNSRNLGALIVDERPHVREWDEPQFNIQNLGIEESYGFGVLNEGQAIAVAKNCSGRRNGTPNATGRFGALGPARTPQTSSCRRRWWAPTRWTSTPMSAVRSGPGSSAKTGQND